MSVPSRPATNTLSEAIGVGRPQNYFQLVYQISHPGVLRSTRAASYSGIKFHPRCWCPLMCWWWWWTWWWFGGGGALVACGEGAATGCIFMSPPAWCPPYCTTQVTKSYCTKPYCTKHHTAPPRSPNHQRRQSLTTLVTLSFSLRLK